MDLDKLSLGGDAYSTSCKDIKMKSWHLPGSVKYSLQGKRTAQPELKRCRLNASWSSFTAQGPVIKGGTAPSVLRVSDMHPTPQDGSDDRGHTCMHIYGTDLAFPECLFPRNSKASAVSPQELLGPGGSPQTTWFTSSLRAGLTEAGSSLSSSCRLRLRGKGARSLSANPSANEIPSVPLKPICSLFERDFNSLITV